MMIIFKVNGYTLRETNPVIFSFASLLNRGKLLKELIYSLEANSFLKQ